MPKYLDPADEVQQTFARHWFKALRNFHRQPHSENWAFDYQHVVAFLRSKREENMPAWKRAKIVEGLIWFRKYIQNASVDELIPVREKLVEFAIAESRLRAKTDDPSSESLDFTQVPLPRKDADVASPLAVGTSPIGTKGGSLDSSSKKSGGSSYAAPLDRLPDDLLKSIPTYEPDVIQAVIRSLRYNQYAFRTEKAYVKNIKAFMRARGLKNLADFESICGKDVEDYLTDLVIDGDVAKSTQDQSFYSLLYLFEKVLHRSLKDIDAIRSNKQVRIPSVMSTNEVTRVLGNLRGIYRTIGEVLYGCGLRITECMRLRVKDIDFDQRQIQVHSSKGNKSRLVPLPERLVEPLRAILERRKNLHDRDLEDGMGSVWMPNALDVKFPNASMEFKWQYVFASQRHSKDPRTGSIHRHHLHTDTFHDHLRVAVVQANVLKHVTSHTFRHSFATHLLQAGTDIRTIQELLGHNDLATTMVYTHVLARPDVKVVSPLDRLQVEEHSKLETRQQTASDSKPSCRSESLGQEKQTAAPNSIVAIQSPPWIPREIPVEIASAASGPPVETGYREENHKPIRRWRKWLKYLVSSGEW